MLTAVQSEKTSARAIALSTVVMVLFSIAPFFITTQNGEKGWSLGVRTPSSFKIFEIFRLAIGGGCVFVLYKIAI